MELNPTYHYNKLKSYLIKLDKIVSVDKLLSKEIDYHYTQQYYTKTQKYYRKFHSPEGAMHFPIYLKKRMSHKEALSVQSNIIQEYIQEKNVQNILELGCGQGYNTCLLAPKNPAIQFRGIDLTPQNVKRAKEKSVNLTNTFFDIGNFENLPYEDNHFDLLFAIETLCHAIDRERVLKEAYRVLKPAGIFIVFDGFSKSSKFDDVYTEQARQLLALAFALPKFENLIDWKIPAKQLGFTIKSETDFSKTILPNLKRFQKGGEFLLKYSLFSKILFKTKIFDIQSMHLIAGLMAASLLEGEMIAYYLLVMEKEGGQ